MNKTLTALALLAAALTAGCAGTKTWQDEIVAGSQQLGEEIGGPADIPDAKQAAELVDQTCADIESGAVAAPDFLSSGALTAALLRNDGVSEDALSTLFGAMDNGMKDTCPDTYDEMFPTYGLSSLTDLAACHGDLTDFTGDAAADVAKICME